jgi:hypothetical protein
MKSYFFVQLRNLLGSADMVLPPWVELRFNIGVIELAFIDLIASVRLF